MNAIDPSSVKGIIFDLDGTLYHMEWFFRPLMWFLMFPHPLRLPRYLKERSRVAGVDLGSREALFSLLCSGLAGKEHTSQETIHQWIFNKFYPAFINIMALQRRGRQHLNQTLNRLHENSIRLAVLSDYHAVEERLRKLHINLSSFDCMTSSENEGALKPSPRPFLQIAQQWDLCASSVLVIGDREDTDGKAAKNAGMQFWLLSDKKLIKTGYDWKNTRRMLHSLCRT